MKPRDVRTHALFLIVMCAGLTSCDGEHDFASSLEGDLCIIPESEIVSGGPAKDGIPALTNPTLVQADAPGTEYLRDDERVIGLTSASGPVAVPIQVLWWHEIVNLELDGQSLAITHCPLTGSSLVFDRGPLGGVEFGVSGLLYQNNLIMYDRSTDESLWPQMSRGARCGTRVGLDLTMAPALEMTWEAWRDLHPDTRVVSADTGHERDYTAYPYGRYRAADNPNVFFPMPGPIDLRRLPKELVLGVPGSEGGVAYPFGELAAAGPVGAIHHEAGAATYGGRVVFWDAAGEAAGLYRRALDGQELSFGVSGGAIIDLETGSEWRIDGLATSGPLAGRRLERVAAAYVAYWFAWAAFEPNTVIWQAP